MYTPLQSLAYVIGHPLASKRPFSALGRYFWWQTISRLRAEVEYDWVKGSKLLVKKGMTGATGNIYCGLHEFYDMGFLLHFLRAEDLFLDVGANIGSYTILASAVCGSHVIAVEPDPKSMGSLKRNLELNGIISRVDYRETAVGANTGKIRFTVGRDTMNRVNPEDGEGSQVVELSTLDLLVGGRRPVLLKMDVEGFEGEVIRGAIRTITDSSLLAIITESAEEEVRDPLERAGFQPFNYDPMGRMLCPNVRNNARYSGNSLYIRDLKTVQERISSAPRMTIAGVTF